MISHRDRGTSMLISLDHCPHFWHISEELLQYMQRAIN